MTIPCSLCQDLQQPEHDRPSRRLVLAESVDAAPQSIQDREWEPTGSLVRSVVAPVFPMSDDADVEVAIVPHAAIGGPRRVVLVPLSLSGTPRSIQDHTVEWQQVSSVGVR